MNKESGSQNIQDSYLERARKERAWLTVFLNSGKRITGRIRSFDRYTLILEDRGAEQMIFKHAIATISTARAFTNSISFEAPDKGSARGTAEGPAKTVPTARSNAPGAGETTGGKPGPGESGP
jgi:host factor-I protein